MPPLATTPSVVQQVCHAQRRPSPANRKLQSELTLTLHPPPTSCSTLPGSRPQPAPPGRSPRLPGPASAVTPPRPRPRPRKAQGPCVTSDPTYTPCSLHCGHTGREHQAHTPSPPCSWLQFPVNSSPAGVALVSGAHFAYFLSPFGSICVHVAPVMSPVPKTAPDTW